MLRKCEST